MNIQETMAILQMDVGLLMVVVVDLVEVVRFKASLRMYGLLAFNKG